MTLSHSVESFQSAEESVPSPLMAGHDSLSHEDISALGTHDKENETSPVWNACLSPNPLFRIGLLNVTGGANYYLRGLFVCVYACLFCSVAQTAFSCPFFWEEKLFPCPVDSVIGSACPLPCSCDDSKDEHITEQGNQGPARRLICGEEQHSDESIHWTGRT